MERNIKPIVSNCSFSNIKPAMMDLPYPPIQVRERNQNYADLLNIDYCGAVSEMSAVVQYIGNESRMVCEQCAMAKTILGIAMAEMMHLQKLGELICLLGGTVDFTVRQTGGNRKMWTPAYVTIPEYTKKMLWADVDSEKAAINQYKMHMNMIDDEYVNAVLARIIKDEEYHIMMLQALLEER